MVRMAVARSLPAHIVQQHQVLPVAVSEGTLSLATPAIPSEQLQERLRSLTSLETEFILVPADNFRQLCRHLLGEQGGVTVPAPPKAKAKAMGTS